MEELPEALGSYDEGEVAAAVEDRTRDNIRAAAESLCSDGQNKNTPVDIRVGQEAKVRENEPWFYASCYPWLFPNGDGDISGWGRFYSFDISGTSVADLKSWLEGLIMFEDGRFSKDPSFVFHVSNIIPTGSASSLWHRPPIGISKTCVTTTRLWLKFWPRPGLLLTTCSRVFMPARHR